MPKSKTTKVKVPKLLVEPNQGTVNSFAKSLKRFLAASNKELIAKALVEYEQMISGRVVMEDAMPTVSGMSLQLAETLARMRIAFEPNTPAREISRQFVRRMLRDITRAQWRSLERAGVSVRLLRNTFTIPVIRGQFIAPSTAQKIPDFVEWSTDLITRMSKQSRLDIQRAIAQSLDSGAPLSALRNTIASISLKDAERAARVALDQSCKLNNFIQIENCKALGITEGIWIHVPGQYTSRMTHMAMDNTRFDLTVGMYDPDPEVMRNVQPGELPYCRCIYRPVLPGVIMENED